jgi:hypothetical protein
MRSLLKRKVGREDIVGLAVCFLIGAAVVLFLNSKDPTGHVVGAWLISLVIGVICHELGHAIACQSLGGNVDYIELGQKYSSKPWLVFRFLGFTWHICSVPMSGRVHGSFSSASHYRLRRCLFILGGPLVNLIFLGAGLICFNLYQRDQQPDFLLGWIAANCILCVTSLLPMKFRSAGKMHPNDAMLFAQALRYSDSEIAHFVEAASFRLGFGKDHQLATKMPTEELISRYTMDPGNLAFGVALVDKLHASDDELYLTILLKILDQPRAKGQFATQLIDSYLTWQLNRGPSDQPETMEKLSMRLLTEDHGISAKGTRGSVLIDRGRIGEGKAILEEVLAQTTSTIDKTYSNIFLALAAKSEGNLALARNHAAAAAKIDPACPALRRVGDLLT